MVGSKLFTPGTQSPPQSPPLVHKRARPSKRLLNIPNDSQRVPEYDFAYTETTTEQKTQRREGMYDPWLEMVVNGKSVQVIRRIDFQYGCDKFGMYDDGSFQFDKVFVSMNKRSDIDRVNLVKLDEMNHFFQTYMARYLLVEMYQKRPIHYYLQKYKRNQLIWVKLAYCSFPENDLGRDPTVMMSLPVFDITTYYHERREIGPEVVNGCLYKHHPSQIYEKTD